ncbi:response regulator transcription factor [Actinomycetaceae bacterium WB03_NA08]|uniref:Response regulator transcription factor n=2 Tax=Scrofimicrobium canadense TaxID=2652290 RepID=A0A6N7W5X9_9ACTO|nr:response regulator transcription factor [Scrofimicrobium canadense]
MVRVLVVDDEPSLQVLLKTVLLKEGWDVVTVGTGAEAVLQAREFRPHLIVLDVILPDIDGMQVLETIRREGNDAMVLFLTANSDVEDRIDGIAAGGDDYVTKPFSIKEVVVRLHALLRRSTVLSPSSKGQLHVGSLELDENSFTVTRGERHVQLTVTEFSLLKFLMSKAGSIVTKSEILKEVWGREEDDNSNLVELYISYLRKKIDADANPMIHTIRGAGYVLKSDIPS